VQRIWSSLSTTAARHAGHARILRSSGSIAIGGLLAQENRGAALRGRRSGGPSAKIATARRNDNIKKDESLLSKTFPRRGKTRIAVGETHGRRPLFPARP
jgi:hypothetical protein